MNKTKRTEVTEKILVDIEGLQELLSIGRSTADKVGEEAGAVVRIGRRKLYNVAKVAAYMDKLMVAKVAAYMDKPTEE